jgi:S-formylglutathione hydrolase
MRKSLGGTAGGAQLTRRNSNQEASGKSHLSTQAPWNANYRMEAYIGTELPKIVATNFPVQRDRQGLSGHSMGGHGAITLALKNPGQWKSLSAFAPIASPMRCAWGEKALSNYIR